MSGIGKDNQDFIRLDGAAFRLFDRLVFLDTTWHLRRGEQWAVVGPNGSGKTVLAQALAGEWPLVRGSLTYHFDGDAGTEPEKRIAHVSFADQRQVLRSQTDYYQARWMSFEADAAPRAGDLLTCDGEIANPQAVERPEPWLARHRRRIVGQVGIADLLDRRVVHLSIGEMRKVLVARALVRAPKLLILDDPFAGLDNRSRSALRDLVGRLIRSGEQLLLITPRPDEVSAAITHVAVLDRLRIVAQGTRRAILGSRIMQSLSARPRRSVFRRVAACPPSSSRELVRIARATVRYNGLDVLRDIDWTIRAGEHWALLGPNGSGKTTLLSLIVGDNPQAYANDVRLFGRQRGSGETIWDIRRHIGLHSPEMQIHYVPGLSALDVVCSGFFDSVGLYRTCSARQRRAARAALADLGIAALACTPFEHISDGQQRLVLLARALVKRPDLLVLDEPGQGLDAANLRRILDVIDAVAGRGGTTLIYVTHHFDELPACISHVLKLCNGRIVKQGARSGVMLP